MKKPKVIQLHCYINSTQDPELHARFSQLKHEYPFLNASRLMRKLLRDWVEQQIKEKK
jgi:hypothetical protein